MNKRACVCLCECVCVCVWLCLWKASHLVCVSVCCTVCTVSSLCTGMQQQNLCRNFSAFSWEYFVRVELIDIFLLFCNFIHCVNICILAYTTDDSFTSLHHQHGVMIMMQWYHVMTHYDLHHIDKWCTMIFSSWSHYPACTVSLSLSLSTLQGVCVCVCVCAWVCVHKQHRTICWPDSAFIFLPPPPQAIQLNARRTEMESERWRKRDREIEVERERKWQRERERETERERGREKERERESDREEKVTDKKQKLTWKMNNSHSALMEKVKLTHHAAKKMCKNAGRP